MKRSTIRRWRYAFTPLQIRHTIRRARLCPNTSVILCQLVLPYPWYFAVPEPLTLKDLQRSPEIINIRQSGIRHQFEIPLFRARDTSLRSLYRLHDDICAGNLLLMGYECEYMFRQGSKRWLISQIPDPKDSDPVRYAVLASLVEALVDVFNWRLELGIRRGGLPCDQSEGRATNFVREAIPMWTQTVPAIDHRVDLIDHKREPGAIPDKNFLKRNIEATTGYMYTV